MPNDIFDNKILCSRCNVQMKKAQISKNGFILRVLICPKCNEKIIHPADEAEYNKFVNLKNKEFKVKMRLVGNSYAVSIPMEIVNFMNQQQKMMDEMVKLCFEDMNKVSLNFNNPEDESEDVRIIKSREIRVVKNNKPVLHTKQFSDSAHPEKNRTQIIKKEKPEEHR